MSTLTELRQSLSILESYELPERYQPFAASTATIPITTDNKDDEGSNANGNDTPSSPSSSSSSPSLLDADIVARYRRTRAKYVRRRTQELFLEHLTTLRYNDDNDNDDNDNHDASHSTTTHQPIMELPNQSEIIQRSQDVQMTLQTLRKEIGTTCTTVRQSYRTVHEKYQLLVQKRHLLRSMIQEMEMMEEDGDGDGDGDGKDQQQLLSQQTETDVGDDNGKELKSAKGENVEMADMQDDDDDDDDEELQALWARRHQLEGQLRQVQVDNDEMKSRIMSERTHLKQLLTLQQQQQRHGNDHDAEKGKEKERHRHGGKEQEQEHESENTSSCSINVEEMNMSQFLHGTTTTTTTTDQDESHITSPTNSSTTSPVTHPTSNSNDDSAHAHSHSPTTVMIQSMNVQQIQQKVQQYQTQVQKIDDLSACYESLKGALENVSGIQILSVAFSSGKSGSSDSVSGSSSDSGKENHPKDGDITITMTVRLLGKHIVQFTLVEVGKEQSSHSSSSSSLGTSSEATATTTKTKTKTTATTETFRVTHAKLLTSSVLTNATDTDTVTSNSTSTPTATSNSHHPTHNNTISIPIPPLDDLVSLSKHLEPSHDLRFVLRETLARIRTLSARLVELSTLKKNYLTKIIIPTTTTVPANVPATSSGNGGTSDHHHQEVICSLNAQISIVMKLTPDCPLIRGSVTIVRIVGHGGWDDHILNNIQYKINERKHRSPVDVMNDIVEELHCLEHDHGIVPPRTPILPMIRRGNGNGNGGVHGGVSDGSKKKKKVLR